MKVSGKITDILATETGEGKNGQWQKRTVVVTDTEAKYPKPIAVQQWGDMIADTPLSVGDTVTFSINIESREYNGRYYTDVKAWKVEVTDTGGAVDTGAVADTLGDDADSNLLPF